MIVHQLLERVFAQRESVFETILTIITVACRVNDEAPQWNCEKQNSFYWAAENPRELNRRPLHISKVLRGVAKFGSLLF